METVDGSVTVLLPEDRLTIAPEEPAGPERVIFPVAFCPEVTVTGETEKPVTVTEGLTVKVVFFVTPLADAEMVAVTGTVRVEAVDTGKDCEDT
jgi:hypothetical protein